MKKHISLSGKMGDKELGSASHSWLLHARYVRGEHDQCLRLFDELQRKFDNRHAYAHYVKGMVLADAGRLQDALERFHFCTRLQPHESEPVKQVAKCLFLQGRYQLSLEAYQEANKLSNHRDPEICSAIAECLWNLGHVEKSIEWARAGVQAGGGERASGLLARLLHASGDISGALAAYDQALDSQACGAETLSAHGILCLRNGDPRRAFQLLGAALSQQPAQHAAALALAAMMHEHKDLDAALARLKVALSAHPNCVAAHNNLGLALMGKKKYVAALTCLQRAVWTAPLSSRAAHNLGFALLVCRRPTSAFCRLTTAAALQPHQPYTVLLIAIALERLRDGRANAAFVRAAAIAPEDPLIRLNLAGSHARAGRLVAALEEADYTAKLLKKQAKPDPRVASSLATLWALLKEAGVNIPVAGIQVPDTVVSNTKEDLNSPDEDQFAADEV